MALPSPSIYPGRVLNFDREPFCMHILSVNGPLVRYVKLRVAHAPGMPGSFSPPPRVSDPDMHHGTCVTHVPWCMPGSLTSSFLWSRSRGKRSRHSRRMRNPQFYVIYIYLVRGPWSFAAAPPMLWNNLPLKIKRSPSVAIFKSRIKTYLFQLAYFTWLFKCMCECCMLLVHVM